MADARNSFFDRGVGVGDRCVSVDGCIHVYLQGISSHGGNAEVMDLIHRQIASAIVLDELTYAQEPQKLPIPGYIRRSAPVVDAIALADLQLKPQSCEGSSQRLHLDRTPRYVAFGPSVQWLDRVVPLFRSYGYF